MRQSDFSPPEVAIVPVTYRCDAHCRFCGVWRRAAPEAELSAADYSRLFSQPLLRDNIRSINVTGGEPTLREDLTDLVAAMSDSCGRLELVTLNSNGLCPEVLLKAVYELCSVSGRGPDFHLSCFVSLDGIGELHGRLRGVEGAFEAVNESLCKLRVLKRTMDFDIGVNFTITPYNYGEMESVLKYAGSSGVGVSFTCMMESEVYFRTERPVFDALASDRIASFFEKYVGHRSLLASRAYYQDLVAILKGNNRKTGCVFRERGFFLAPRGEVYRCWGSNVSLGNVLDEDFHSLWARHGQLQSRDSYNARCAHCYNNCYVGYGRSVAISSLVRRLNIRA